MSREKGCFEPLHQTLLEAHFVRGLDIGRVDVLAALAAECGMEPAEVRTVLGVSRFGPRLDEMRAALLAERIPGVPFLKFNNKALAGLESAAQLQAFLAGR
jgi:predicted DsbA family dithiol-disulfide isomerase